MRLWMLIGALHQKLESIHWYKRCCTSSYIVVATMKSWTYELLSFIQLLYSAQICITLCNWSKRDFINTIDAVWWYISTYSKTLNFLSIPADRHIAPALLHCVKGHSYSAAGEVLWLYSIAPAEELCVKGHSRTHNSTQLEELNTVGVNLENTEGYCSWSQMKKELQEHVFPAHRSFTTWSSEEKGVDWVLNRKAQTPWRQLSSHSFAQQLQQQPHLQQR